MCGVSIVEFDAGVVPEHRVEEARVLINSKRTARRDMVKEVMPVINADPFYEM